MPPRTLDVYADIACPWCYVGEASLARALAAWDGPPVRRRWRPFQLRPHLPPGGRPWRPFAEQKFGGWERAKAAFAHVAAAGARAGVAFDFERLAAAPNTADAHRLVLAAEADGRGEAVADALFRGYFAEGRNPSARADLLARAEAAGWPREAAAAVLDTDAWADAVRASQAEAARLGITSVPCFVYGTSAAPRLAVSGAQPAEAHRQALEQVAAAAA